MQSETKFGIKLSNIQLLIVLAGILTSVLIRHSAFTTVFVTADDVVHLPWGHLLSYRPLQALDLLIWQSIFGPDYLWTRIPTVISHIYLAGLLTGVVLLAGSFRIVPVAQLLIVLLISSSPQMNPYLVWNVFACSTLSLALLVWAFWITNSCQKKHAITASLLVLSSLCIFQMSFGLYLALLTTVLILPQGNSRKEVLYRHSKVLLIGVGCYAIYIAVSKYVGVQAWDQRGLLSMSGLFSEDILSQKWHGFANFIANLYQPAFGVVFGLKFATKFGFYAHFGVALLLSFAHLLATRELKKSLAICLVILLAPIAAGMILLPLSVTPSGLRIEGSAIVALALSAGVAISAIAPRIQNKLGVVLAGVVVLAVLSANSVTSSKELRMRISGYEADTWIVKGIKKSDTDPRRGSRLDIYHLKPTIREESFIKGRKGWNKPVVVNYKSYNRIWCLSS